MNHYLSPPEERADLENFPRQEDCPCCGRPTLVAERYASYDPEVRLDAMPVETFTRHPWWPHGAKVEKVWHPRPSTEQYVEHVCPMSAVLSGVQE